MNGAATLRGQLDQIQSRSLIAGTAILAICAIAAIFDRQQFVRSYLVGYLLWLGIAVGSMALLMLHHLVGGNWGFVIRRILESAARTIPLMALFFVPLLLGLSALYVWVNPHPPVAGELQPNRAYLNVPFFLARTALYFVVWIAMARALNHWSRAQDQTGDQDLTRRFQVLSGPGIIVYGLTVTFASIDWVMSLEPLWYSTMYGVIFIVGQGLSTLAFAIIILSVLAQYQPVADVVTKDHFHDLGNLMFAFLMLWAYTSFSQLLIIWSADLPEEIPWYVRRLHGGWGWIAVSLVLLHFVLPFLLLLSRRVKRGARTLIAVAGAVIVMRLVDLFWVVAPSFYEHGFHLHWLDLAAPLGLGGIWLAMFIRELKSMPPLPLRDPNFAAAALQS